MDQESVCECIVGGLFWWVHWCCGQETINACLASPSLPPPPTHLLIQRCQHLPLHRHRLRPRRTCSYSAASTSRSTGTALPPWPLGLALPTRPCLTSSLCTCGGAWQGSTPRGFGWVG